MPSRRHELLAHLVPRMRKSRELESPEAEKARLEQWHTTLDRDFPTHAVPLFDRRYAVVREDLPAGFPAYTLTRRGRTPTRTVVYLHGGGFVGPLDPFLHDPDGVSRFSRVIGLAFGLKGGGAASADSGAAQRERARPAAPAPALCRKPRRETPRVLPTRRFPSRPAMILRFRRPPPSWWPSLK